MRFDARSARSIAASRVNSSSSSVDKPLRPPELGGIPPEWATTRRGMQRGEANAANAVYRERAFAVDAFRVVVFVGGECRFHPRPLQLAPPRPHETHTDKMSAQVQFMITNAMRQTLVEELDFKPEEVDVMRPDVAAELIQKKMKRPFGDRPMPDAWKKDYEGLGAGENGGGGGGGLGIFQPISDLFRSVFYMTLTAGFCLGVACGISPEAREGVRATYKDIRRDVRRRLKGKKPKKRKSATNTQTRSTAGRGSPVSA